MHNNKKGLWLEKANEVCGLKSILETIHKLSFDMVGTVDEVIKKNESKDYDFFILEPTIMMNKNWPNFQAVAAPFKQKILDKLMETNKPIILASDFPEIWRPHKLPENVGIICKPTDSDEIINTLNELFKKCRSE